MATLEEHGAKIAQEQGFDPATPEVQAQIAGAASQLRSQMPGVSDDEIIANAGPKMDEVVAGAKAGQWAPAQPAQPTAPVAPTAASRVAAVQEQFNPAAEQALKDRANFKGAITEGARVASLGLRAMSSPQAQAALDSGYREQKVSDNAQVLDWQTKKKTALAEVEDQVKAGVADRQEVKDKFLILGMEQLQAERRDAASRLAAENDPTSVSSEMARSVAATSAPDIAKNLPNFNKLSAAQLKQYLPALEKRMAAEEAKMKADLDRLEKDKDRTSREKIAAGSAAATLEAARLRETGADRRAAARTGTGAVLKPTEARMLAKDEGELKRSLAAANSSEKLLDEAEKLLKNVPTGPNVGPAMGTWVGQRFASNDRKRLQQIQQELTNNIAMLAKGAQTEGDVQRYAQITDMLSMEDPSAGIAAARAKLSEDKGAIQGNIDEISSIRGVPPAASTPAGLVEVTKEQYDKLPVGAIYLKGGVQYTKGK